MSKKLNKQTVEKDLQEIKTKQPNHLWKHPKELYTFSSMAYKTSADPKLCTITAESR